MVRLIDSGGERPHKAVRKDIVDKSFLLFRFFSLFPAEMVIHEALQKIAQTRHKLKVAGHDRFFHVSSDFM